MTFSIMITTRNRCNDLRRTLDRLRQLHPAPLEILVCADGCTDATVAMVRTEYPDVILLIHQASVGSVGSRNELLHRARGEWVLSLDDDSYPVASDFLERAPEVICTHPKAMVITFPELLDGGFFASASKTPESPGHYVSAYPNCASLMHREFYLKQPGFPPHFIHMYEEPDYALQCYAAGVAVWFEPALTVRHHLSSAQRQPEQRHHQNARNELWSVWMRCPWPWLPLVSMFRVWRQFRYARSEGLGWVVREPIWWWAALSGIAVCWRSRNPVAWRSYLAWMKLARQPIQDRSALHRAFNLQTS